MRFSEYWGGKESITIGGALGEPALLLPVLDEDSGRIVLVEGGEGVGRDRKSFYPWELLSREGEGR